MPIGEWRERLRPTRPQFFVVVADRISAYTVPSVFLIFKGLQKPLFLKHGPVAQPDRAAVS